MDRATLAEHLATAERHVAVGDAHIQRQREIVEELQREGHDTLMAKSLLASFELTQTSHIEDRDRLKKELAGI